MLHALYNAVEQDGQMSFEERMGVRIRGLHGLHVQDEIRQQTHLPGGPGAADRRDYMVGKQIVPEGTVTEVDTSVELCGLRLDNPVVPGQRDVRLRL